MANLMAGELWSDFLVGLLGHHDALLLVNVNVAAPAVVGAGDEVGGQPTHAVRQNVGRVDSP